MITLSNGHKFEFCCASGALGYDGEGWWFEQPWKWMGLIDPSAFTIITKTLTYFPRKGNLNMWRPWQCVRMGLGYVVNAVGLTNPGYQWWINGPYHHVKEKGYNVIVSLMPESLQEAKDMATDLNPLDIAGVELNVSCPNVKHDSTEDWVCGMVEHFCKYTNHPVILKLSYNQPFVEICKRLDRKVAAFDLINSVPWKMIYPYDKSPLHKLGGGGVSGTAIRVLSTIALLKVKKWVDTPVISGGGITSYREAALRFKLGADAVSFGTVFMKTPWRPNKIIRDLRESLLLVSP